MKWSQNKDGSIYATVKNHPRYKTYINLSVHIYIYIFNQEYTIAVLLLTPEPHPIPGKDSDDSDKGRRGQRDGSKPTLSLGS